MRNVQPAESFTESLFDPNWGHVPGNKVSGAPANNCWSRFCAFEIKEGTYKEGNWKQGGNGLQDE